MIRLFLLVLLIVFVFAIDLTRECHADQVDDVGVTELTTQSASSKRQQSLVLGKKFVDLNSFLIEVSIDPTKREKGDLQAVAGFSIGLNSLKDDPFAGQGHVRFELREGERRGFWDIWIDGVNEPRREPSPLPAGWCKDHRYQQPWEFTPHEGGYKFRIVGTPREDGTHLRFYFEHFDRPIFEFTRSEKLRLGHIAYYAVTGGQESRKNTSVFENLKVENVSRFKLPSARDIILDEIDLTHPEMVDVAEALQKNDRELAGQRLLKHFRTRKTPVGPGFRTELHGPYQEVADAALEDRYGTLGPFKNFSKSYVDGAGTTQNFVDDDGTIRWDLCHGHLTRHFHWVSLAKAYSETNDKRYAHRFSREVQDWVAREPFLHPRNPDIFNLNWMDGTAFKLGYMNTSNIGRRCELTWWPAYEEFRKSPDFTDEAHFHMLLGFLRQSRLIMNPSSFAAHDDGGAHTCVALLQNALMLPELVESKRWMKEAVRRWKEVLKIQFHEDGSHVSLSTGYNWASLKAMENMIALYRRVGRQVPQHFLDVLETAYEHPVALSRPDQAQIDMNDGGWGMIDDHMRRACKLFPHREDFLWMATKGKQGSPPDYRSIYFPNAGHTVMRTGWGPKHRYLFMDAGPVGASHGKEDKLNIYVDYGGHQLLASGGRGSYAGGPYAAYTGSTRGYNTILVDGGVQARIPHRFEIKGHVPEKRRWVTSDRFDFAEGFHTHGWFAPGKHVRGKQTRQILFIKGTNPPETSYWVVFDTIKPADQEQHEYEALFHVRRNHAGLVDKAAKMVHAWDTSASLRIMPAVTQGLQVELVRGQTKPHIQGWHVVGKKHAPMWTPTFRWKASGVTTRAWVLIPAGSDQKWCVDRLELQQSDAQALVFRCFRSDGSSDLIYRRNTDNTETVSKDSVKLRGEIGVVSWNADNQQIDQFVVPAQP